jgi:hypothetical protein
MNVKKLAATAAISATMGLGAIAAGAPAQADPDYWEPKPPPGQVGQWLGVPPGQVGHVVGVPPGHWDKPWKWFR